MKSTKKFLCILLSVLMLITCISASFTVNASTGTLSKYYATNPDNKVGMKKTITVDGDASDWSEDMLIAQSAAWDVANHFKGGHENCVLDTYALFATWDDNNLYVGWQMVNTTDTWAREGDGPLSDGGRVLDVPLILALSVNPSSTSMSNKNTDGRPIWGQKMGLTFDNHVDHLLYMSGKPGLGEPAMFTAVDADGNTNYTSGCHTFKSTGIEYKMAETNICPQITGLNYSEDPDDVYNDAADWVDYKTFRGSSGKHNTKYDSFYEIKIPLSSMGIDSTYIENYGIGAMVVATRGESGLDCIPFDDTMLDNALGSYASDPSTSHEKDDEDVITSEFARIGKLSGGTPTPQPSTTKPTVESTTAKPTDATTTAKPTVETTTAKPTTASNLSVKATSNLFPEKNLTVSKDAKTVTVNYDLKSAMMIANGQAKLSYDPSVLRFDPAKNKDIMPYVSNETVNSLDSYLRMIFTDVKKLYDFTSSKSFVNVTFDVLSTGSTTVDLRVEELSVGYFNNSGVLEYKNAVVRGANVDLSKTPGFTNSSLGGTTSIVADQVATTVKPTDSTQPQGGLTVKSTSNLFGTASKTYDKNTKQLTVTYELSSNFKLLDAQWVLTYDTSKLAYSSSNTPETVMPNISASQVHLPEEGRLKGTFSNPSLYNFTEEKAFVTVVFDVLGTGTADVNLDVDFLGLAYLDSAKDTHKAYLVDKNIVNDITKVPGFETATYSVKTVFDAEPEYILGDVDLDGELTVKDATLIGKYIVELAPLTDLQKKIANVDGDDDITVMDATYIQKIIVELIKI